MEGHVLCHQTNYKTVILYHMCKLTHVYKRVNATFSQSRKSHYVRTRCISLIWPTQKFKQSFFIKEILCSFKMRMLQSRAVSNQEQVILAHENMKKAPSKVAHNRPNFFCSTGPAAQTAQKQKSHTNKSPLMQDRVIRLGCKISLCVKWYRQISILKRFWECLS